MCAYGRVALRESAAGESRKLCVEVSAAGADRRRCCRGHPRPAVGCRLRASGQRDLHRSSACDRGRDASSGLPGEHRLQRAHQPDRRPLRPGRAGVRRGEGGRDQGLRQLDDTTPTVVRRPSTQSPRLLGPRPARARARSEVPDASRTSTSSTRTTRRSAAPRRAGTTAARRRPAPTADGCVISGRLSRLTRGGNVMTTASRC